MFKSLLNKFSKSREVEPINLSGLNADMHSHLIPGIDDGAKTVEESIELIRILHGLGYSKLITTPHIMSDYFRNTPENISEGLALVRAALEAEKKQLEKTLADSASYGSSNAFQLNRQLSSILEKCELKSSRWDQLTTEFAAKYPEATSQESEQDLS